jgi:hypothetical protein
MTGDDDSLELKLARAYRDEAEQHRKAAEQDLEAARYERGQAEHAKRAMEQLERSIAARERKLKELGEAEFVAREKAAADKLKQAQQLMKEYNAVRHGAMIALQQIDARERQEREQSAA